MKYSDVINRVRELYPNEYKDEELLGWMQEVDSDIRRNIERNPAPVNSVKAEDTVIIPAPYSDMYLYYILSRIAYHQKDFESHTRHEELYREKRNLYMAYYIRTYGSDAVVFKNWI